MGKEKDHQPHLINPAAYLAGSETKSHSYEWFRRYVGRSYRTVLRSWRIPRGSAVLDIGAGKGEVAQYLREIHDARVYQTDLSVVPLRLQQPAWWPFRGRSARRAIADAPQQPFADRTFPAIHCKDVLVHLPDQFSFFREIHRLLTPGGSFLLTTQLTESNWVSVSANRHAEENEDERIPLHSLAHYLAVVSDIQAAGWEYNGKPVAVIHPPYFAVNRRQVIRMLREVGFSINANVPVSWRPGTGEFDWHGEDRSIISCTKK